MLPLRLSLPSVLLTALAASGTCLAASPGPYRLEITLQAGSEACLEPEALAAQIKERVGSEAFDPKAAPVVRVVLDGHAEGHRATVTILEPLRAPRVSTFTAPRCAEVVEAAALTLALALEDPSEAPRAEGDHSPDDVVLDEATTPAPVIAPAPLRMPRAAPEDAEPVDAWTQVRKNWLGLEVASDFVILPSNTSLCDFETRGRRGIDCYEGDTLFEGEVHPDAAGAVRGGVVRETTRLLASYERLLTPIFGLAARGGLAFQRASRGGRNGFMPFHLEADARFYLVPRGQGPVDVFLLAGAGIAQITSIVPVEVAECPEGACPESPESVEAVRELSARFHHGLAFATVALGSTWMVTDAFGLFGRMGVLSTFPAMSVILQPSVGVTTGF
jgi:hypothetical protein